MVHFCSFELDTIVLRLVFLLLLLRLINVEYLQSMKRYSNTEYIFRSWFPFVIGLGTFIIFYTSNIYKRFYYQEEYPTVVRFCSFLWLKKKMFKVPAWVRFLTFFLWQNVPPLLLILFYKPLKHFMKIRIEDFMIRIKPFPFFQRNSLLQVQYTFVTHDEYIKYHMVLMSQNRVTPSPTVS